MGGYILNVFIPILWKKNMDWAQARIIHICIYSGGQMISSTHDRIARGRCG